jgi:hypothetical protein
MKISSASTRFIDRPARGFTNESGIAMSDRMSALKGSPIRHESSARLRGVGSRRRSAVALVFVVGARAAPWPISTLIAYRSNSYTRYSGVPGAPS